MLFWDCVNGTIPPDGKQEKGGGAAVVAEILCVGTELLMGQVLNTNAQFLSRRLSALGISVYHQTVVGDNEERLEEAYRVALARADLVITSGGLGPTVDDITKRAAARVLGRELVLRSEAEQMVRERFRQFHRHMTVNNQSQAMFTADTKVLLNPYGTAPAAIVPAGEGKVIVHLPGPPRELEPLFIEQVEPFLKEKTGTVLVSRYIRIFGMGEAEVDMRLHDLEEHANPTLSPYCSTGEVMLRATAAAESEKEGLSMLEPLLCEVQTRLGDVIYEIRGDDGGSLEESCMKALMERQLTLTTAESLTGGLIAATLVEVPGASNVLRGGFVTYQTESKTILLGVPKEQIDRYTVVSAEVAMSMAGQARERLDTDLAVSATGLAGPGGGTEDCPVGTVFLGIANRKTVYAVPLHLTGNRERIRTLTVKHALHALRREAEGRPVANRIEPES